MKSLSYGKMSKSVISGVGGAGGHKVDVQFSALTFTVLSKGTGNKIGRAHV